MLANILNLTDYKAVRGEETDHDCRITAEVSNPPTACSSCRSDALRNRGPTTKSSTTCQPTASAWIGMSMPGLGAGGASAAAKSSWDRCRQ